jgi:hypothetical protein
MKEVKFNVEEYHRGKWQPLMVDRKGKEVQSHVIITEEEAEIMNKSKLQRRVRYVLAQKAVVKKEFVLDTAKRAELMSFCKENKIAFEVKEKNAELVAKIKAFQGE